MRPTFSIVTCTLNSARFVRENIDSVERQTLRELEHVLVDGWSSDGTLEILEAYAARDHRVKLLRTPPAGIANAMNVGARSASGEFLLFLNSDDFLDTPDVLRKAADFMARSPASWYYGQVRYVGFPGREVIYPRRWYHKNFSYSWLRFASFINHPAVFLRRDLFERYGEYREDLRGAMDYEYWFRIGRTEQPKYLPFIVSNFRSGGFSTSRENRDLLSAEVARVRQQYLLFPRLLEWPLRIYQALKRLS